jgi:hypothetical protein
MSGDVMTNVAGAVRNRLAPIAGWALVVAFIAPPAFSELVLAVPPSLTAYAVYGAGAVFVLFNWIGPAARSRAARLLQVLALLGGLVLLHLVPWNSRKVFLAEFNRIQPGMTIDQAHATLAAHAIEPDRQTDETVRGYKHSRSPRFDSDIGMVYFANGRVTKTEFLPD